MLVAILVFEVRQVGNRIRCVVLALVVWVQGRLVVALMEEETRLGR